jgi:hypothetical protein
MPGLQITKQINGTDLRWLGTARFRPARTGVLRRAAFAAHVRTGVLHGLASAGYIPAGTPVSKEGAHYVPFTGDNDFDGVLLRDISLADFGADPLMGAPILDDGRVVTEFVPTPGGVPFVAPPKEKNNSTIIFI